MSFNTSNNFVQLQRCIFLKQVVNDENFVCCLVDKQDFIPCLDLLRCMLMMFIFLVIEHI